MKGSAAKIQMTSLDELFGSPTPQATSDQIQEISLTELHSFKDHPFHVVDDEKMQEMAESVAQYGVLVPGIVRPRPEGGYELVAGHRRKRASELAGRETMPVIIRELDNDEATIIMVDSNLQREKILPSEKAFAYKLKLEAMKRKAGRPKKRNMRRSTLPRRRTRKMSTLGLIQQLSMKKKNRGRRSMLILYMTTLPLLLRGRGVMW